MPQKLQPTTIRLTEADQTFLASLKINGATTISDKIRALINDKRLLQLAEHDYKSALTLASNLLGPQQELIKLAENNHNMHSQLVLRVMEWVQGILAVLLTKPVVSSSSVIQKSELEELEVEVAGQIQHLVDIILQSYVSRDTALYQENAMALETLKPLRRLCKMLED